MPDRFFVEILIAAGIAIALVGVFLLLRLVLTFLADADILFTFPREGEVKYTVKGDTLKKVLPRIAGKTVDDKYDLVDSSATETRWWDPVWYLEHFYGIFWIGFPPLRLFIYKFEWDKLASEDEDEYEVKHRNEYVDSLYFRHTYPVVVYGVDLGNNFKIDIYATVVIEAVNVYKPVFTLKGEWFKTVRAAVEGAMNDYPKKLGIDKFREVKKEGPDSQFAKKVLKINDGVGGIIDNTGMKVVAFNYRRYNESPGQPGLVEALQAKGIKELQAQGVIAASVGEATAIKNVGDAQASALEAQLKVADRYRRGAEVIENRNLSRAISEHEGTLVFGQGLVSVDGNSNRGTPGGGQTNPPPAAPPPGPPHRPRRP